MSSPRERIELRFSATDGIPTGRTCLWRWSVTVHAQTRGRIASVGTADVVVFEIGEPDVFDAADEAGADESACVEALFDPDGFLRDDLTEQYFDVDRVLLLNHMVLNKGHRGQGIGPAAARGIVCRLGGSSMLVAARPQPDGWTEMAPNELALATEKLQRTWQGIGLVPYGDTEHFVGASHVVGRSAS